MNFILDCEIAAAKETSLVEDDRPGALAVQGGSPGSFRIAPFGVQTIRVLAGPAPANRPRGSS